MVTFIKKIYKSLRKEVNEIYYSLIKISSIIFRCEWKNKNSLECKRVPLILISTFLNRACMCIPHLFKQIFSKGNFSEKIEIIDKML